MDDSANRYLNDAGKRLSLRRIALIHLLIAAFLVQGLLTQAHFHFIGGGDRHVEAGATVGTSSPAHQHEGNACPLCLAIAFSGSFVAPSNTTLALPTQIAQDAVRAFQTGLAARLGAHDWLSRGPPSTLHDVSTH